MMFLWGLVKNRRGRSQSCLCPLEWYEAPGRHNNYFRNMKREAIIQKRLTVAYKPTLRFKQIRYTTCTLLRVRSDWIDVLCFTEFWSISFAEKNLWWHKRENKKYRVKNGMACHEKNSSSYLWSHTYVPLCIQLMFTFFYLLMQPFVSMPNPGMHSHKK